MEVVYLATWFRLCWVVDAQRFNIKLCCREVMAMCLRLDTFHLFDCPYLLFHSFLTSVIWWKQENGYLWIDWLKVCIGTLLLWWESSSIENPCLGKWNIMTRHPTKRLLGVVLATGSVRLRTLHLLYSLISQLAYLCSYLPQFFNITLSVAEVATFYSIMTNQILYHLDDKISLC